ncbi:MAG: DUF6151 family protein [Granulosicoccus sp.]
MKNRLLLRCDCGSVTGELELASERSLHVVCYCQDCQAFARFLEQQDTVLDAHGGTRILQISPAAMQINNGLQHIKAMRLSPKGILRWHTVCCKTPVGNTLATSKLPFLGLIHTFFSEHKKPGYLDEHFGPVKMGVFAGNTKREATWPVHAGTPAGLIVSTIRNVAGWRLRGDHKHNMFFDITSGQPISNPIVLTLEERNKLASQVT